MVHGGGRGQRYVAVKQAGKKIPTLQSFLTFTTIKMLLVSKCPLGALETNQNGFRQYVGT